MKKLIILILVFTFFCNVKTFAESVDNIIIAGKIVDKTTKDPLPFVTIGIQGFIGTSTDIDGNFKISLESKYLESTLTVSYVGYEKKEISVKINKNKTDLVIELISKDFNLDEINVIAKSLFPYTVLKNVVNNMLYTCYQSPYNYLFTYSQKEYSANKILKTRETTVNYYDNLGYERNLNLEVYKNFGYKILTSKKDFKVESLNDGFVNIDEILKGDILKFSGNILDVSMMQDFDLQLKESFSNGDSVYIITYNCLKPSIFNTGNIFAKTYKGEITIRKKNFSVIKNTIEATSTSLSEIGKSFYFDASKSDFKIENVKYSYTTNYAVKDNVNYLKSINYEVSYDKIDLKTKKTETKKFEEKIDVTSFIVDKIEKIETKQYFDNL